MADNDLHARLVAGDMEALGEVYDAHSPIVYGLAMRVAKDSGQAQEITRDVFVDLWERPFAYDPGQGPLRDWLASRALHRAVTRVGAA